MIRVMLDTDDLAIIPNFAGHVPLLATYSDLIRDHAELDRLRKITAPSKLILIDRALGDPTGQASVADVEPRCLTAAQLPGWFARKTKASVEFLTVYSDRNDLPAIDEALKGTGHENHWRWVATLDGTAFIWGMAALRRPAAVQILGEDKLGIHADLSLVLEDGWHRA